MTSRVVSQDAPLRAALETLLEIVESHGGRLHPAFRIREHGGSVSVHANASNGETLVDLPEVLLVPMTDAQWATNGDRLEILQHDADASAAHREIAEALLPVYDLSGKLHWTRTSLPRAVFRNDPAVLEVLKTLRPALFATEMSEANALLSSRLYNHDGRSYLLPLVDLMNSHRSGSDLNISGDSMTVRVARLPEESECFVSYGPRHDVLDRALVWGYVEQDVSFARSIPLVISVRGIGTIEIVGERVTPRSSIDPPRIAITDDKLTLSHLTFVPDRPQYLSAVLELAVEGLLRRTSKSLDLQIATRQLGDAIIRENLEKLEEARVLLRRRTGAAASFLGAAIDLQADVIRRCGLAVTSRSDSDSE